VQTDQIETTAGEEPSVIMIQSMPGPQARDVLQQKLLFDSLDHLL